MLSVTTLSSYMYCPRSVYLIEVLKVIKPAKKEMVKGTIKHNTFDSLNKLQENIVKSIKSKELADVLRTFTQNYSQALRTAVINNKNMLRKVELPLIDAFTQAWPLFQKESELMAKHVHSFIMKHDVLGEQLWESLTPKIKSEIRIESKELELRGIIDKLEIYPTKVIPIELKSGKVAKEGLWPGHRIQLAAYLMLLQEKYIKSIQSGFIHYIDHDEKRELVMNPFLSLEVLKIRDEVKQLLNSPNIPDICGNKNKCAACGLKNICCSNK